MCLGNNLYLLCTFYILSSGVRQNVPKVSYVSFLDVWMVTCLVFVNGCMFEFILVTALVNRGMEGLGDKVTNIEKYTFLLFLAVQNSSIDDLVTQ